MNDIKSQRDQYSFIKILLIWLTAGLPMWILGWVAYPPLAENLSSIDAAFLRMKLLTAGLIWQFVLAMLILYREEGNIRLSTIQRRFWLNHPVSPKSGKPNRKLWWWIIPLLVLYVALTMTPISTYWVQLFPFLAEPEGFNFGALLENPETQAQLVGSWQLFWLFLLLGLFNTFLGEEFIFRGVLLPKMEGVFGRWDWVANAVLFGFYHLHQPWGILGGIIIGLVLSGSAKYFRTNWFPIILHSGQTIFFLFLILGLVLGLA